jgi:hypothetical protein
MNGRLDHIDALYKSGTKQSMHKAQQYTFVDTGEKVCEFFTGFTL